MKKIIRTAVILIIAALFIGGAFAAPAIGGDKGTIIVKSNAEGATVELYSISGDVAYTGVVENEKAVFEVYSTATPINKAVVSCDGYKSASCTINGNPSKGETVTYTINLKKNTLGGEKGTIAVLSNAEKATVTLLSINTKPAYTSTVQNGQAVFEVYSTATPVNKAVVYGDGYKPSYCVVNGNPIAEDLAVYTVDLEEIPKSTGIGGDKGYILIVANNPGIKAELLDAGSNVLYDGVLDENGVIIFEVYTTATPVVSLKLYTTENPPALRIDAPASGQTLVHYFSESEMPKPVETEPPVANPTEPASSPLGVVVGVFGILGVTLLLRRG